LHESVAELSVMGSGEMVARIVKQVGNRTVDGNKTLTLSARLEALHGPLATSNGKVGIRLCRKLGGTVASRHFGLCVM
jgi:hypothetical protein